MQVGLPESLKQTQLRETHSELPLIPHANFQSHLESRKTTRAQKTPFWAHPAGKWTTKGAAEEDGGGSCSLTSSGEIICKCDGMKYSVFKLERGAIMRRCSKSLIRSAEVNRSGM